MEEYGIIRADCNQMRAVDGKQIIYLEWPSYSLARGLAISGGMSFPLECS